MILVPPRIHRGMLRRPDDPRGIYFQVRAERPIQVPQKMTDPRPPIYQTSSWYPLLKSDGKEIAFIWSGLTEKTLQREALFCRIEEATFADLVLDRQDPPEGIILMGAN